jgi:hypothetical protein
MKFIIRLAKTSISGIILIAIFFSILSPFSTINTYAQADTGAVAGFTECSFDPKTNDADQIQKCLGQIFRFVFVLSIFIIAIRVAILALGNYDPFHNGNADNQAVQVIWEVTIGLILIGGPVLLINVINPVSLNLSFLGIGELATPSTTTSTSVINNPDNIRGNTGTSNEAQPKVENLTAEQISSDVERLNKGQQGGENTNLNGIFNQLIGAVRSGGDILVRAQTEQEEYLAAEANITKILGISIECQRLFVANSQLDDCRNLESEEFANALSNLKPELRTTLTPLVDNFAINQGPLVARVDFFIEDINIIPTNSVDSNCFDHYALIRETATLKPWMAVGKICNNELISDQIWENREGKIFPRSGQEVLSGTQVVGNNGILYLN